MACAKLGGGLEQRAVALGIVRGSMRASSTSRTPTPVSASRALVSRISSRSVGSGYSGSAGRHAVQPQADVTVARPGRDANHLARRERENRKMR